MSDEAELVEWVTQEVSANPILRTRYFTALESGVSPELFVTSQEQFYFAVRYFSRPMAALTARMPDSMLRHSLIHNLAEEHGATEENPTTLDPSLAHDKTFVRFLGTLGVGRDRIATLREGSAVRAFNNALLGVCMMEPVTLAFSCLGVIEYAFAGISAHIGAWVVKHGWVSEANLVHYKLHAEIDERHAADFFKVIAADWGGHPQRRAEIEDGVHLGLYLFARLYVDLWDEAEKQA